MEVSTPYPSKRISKKVGEYIWGVISNATPSHQTILKNRGFFCANNIKNNLN